MKGLYLCAFQALHPDYNIVYQDINGKRDLGGSCLTTSLDGYDYIICTPPCNFWSRANYRRYYSDYSCRTGYLLPSMLEILSSQPRPFIIENVRNSKLFIKYGFFKGKYYTYCIKRHTYFTNIYFDSREISILETEIDNLYANLPHDKRQGFIQFVKSSERQGGDEVHLVIEAFLSKVRSIFYVS